jgi:hypothetical protein
MHPASTHSLARAWGVEPADEAKVLWFEVCS